MTANLNPHRRHSIRLPGYDYAAPGAYFVTVCAHGGECLFGEIVNGEISLNDWGRLVQACWDDLPNHYPHAQMDAFVIMPNHVHGVIVLVDDTDVGAVDVGAGLKPAPTQPAPTEPPADVGAGLPAQGSSEKPAPTEPPADVGAGLPAQGSSEKPAPTMDSQPNLGTGGGDVGAGLKPAPTEPPADVGAGLKPAPTSAPSAPTRRHGLPEIVRAFKTFSARRINELRDSPGLPVWQRNYYEHIVRNEDELRRIRQYILDNPLKWELDRENPALTRRNPPG